MRIMKSILLLAVCFTFVSIANANTHLGTKPGVAVITIQGDGDVETLVAKMTAAAVPGPAGSQFKMPYYNTISGDKVFDFICETNVAILAKNKCMLVIYAHAPFSAVTDTTASLELGRSEDSNLASKSFEADTLGLIFESSDHALTIRSELELGGMSAFSIHYVK